MKVTLKAEKVNNMFKNYFCSNRSITDAANGFKKKVSFYSFFVFQRFHVYLFLQKERYDIQKITPSLKKHVKKSLTHFFFSCETLYFFLF